MHFKNNLAVDIILKFYFKHNYIHYTFIKHIIMIFICENVLKQEKNKEEKERNKKKKKIKR